jgi:integrase
VLRVHLVPQLGPKRLDTITTEDVQRLKHSLRDKAPKTVNNVLTVLGTLLKKAVEWGVIEQMPCSVRLLKTSSGSVDFYDFDEYQRLVAAATATDATTRLIVLLGGDAGLRAGEMRAMQWTDVDLEKGQLRIERSEWQGHITTTKGGRLRYVPMTSRLREALRAHRHLRGARVLYRSDGGVLTESALREGVARATRRANLRGTGPHMLRHTFCSHLAMRGAAPRAIQELAGHRDLSTTQRYMHLSPAAVQSAIRLLEPTNDRTGFGDILETGIPFAKR